MKKNIIKIYYKKVHQKDLELQKDIKDKFLNFNVNKHYNFKKHIKKVKIHKHYLVMHQLYQQQVFLVIDFENLYKNI